MDLILSPLARKDYTDILQYTLETWGNAQVSVYRTILQETLRSIEKNPGVGRHHSRLPAEYRVFQVKRHLIIYFNDNGIIHVARILHEKMDITRHV